MLKSGVFKLGLVVDPVQGSGHEFGPGHPGQT